jgi:hypothetical protein
MLMYISISQDIQARHVNAMQFVNAFAAMQSGYLACGVLK